MAWAELDDPIFNLAIDADGRLWATTGGGALLELDSFNGSVLGRHGDGITQAMAVDPATGFLYVSTGDGVATFDPTTSTFEQFSNVRVDDLQFSPTGELWGTSWPEARYGLAVRCAGSRDADAQLRSEEGRLDRFRPERHAARIKALVDRYNERKEDDVLVSNVLEDFTDEIIDLLQALKKEKESFADLGIDFEEKAFYDILKSISVKYDFSYPDDKLIALSKAVKVIVDDKTKYTDWNRRDDIRAGLKVDLILVLAEFGYPPVANDEVYKEIFEQAENFKKYQSAG